MTTRAGGVRQRWRVELSLGSNGAARSEIHGKGAAKLERECVGERERKFAVLWVQGFGEMWPELAEFWPAAAVLLKLGTNRRKAWGKRTAISRQPNNSGPALPMQPNC
jgi:hypothetical protein